MDPHVLHPGHAPTPFTAAEIRDGCPAGRTMRLRTERRGEPSSGRLIRFVEVDADGALQEVQQLDGRGRPVGDPVTHRSSWLDLQEHASYPAATLTIEEATIELEFGRLATLLYRVRGAAGEERFWFARDLPGMPVRYEALDGDAVTASTVMVDNSVGGS